MTRWLEIWSFLLGEWGGEILGGPIVVFFLIRRMGRVEYMLCMHIFRGKTRSLCGSILDMTGVYLWVLIRHFLGALSTYVHHIHMYS